MPDALPAANIQLILAWDRHQIRWLAYPVAWLIAHIKPHHNHHKQGEISEANIPTIWLGAIPSRLISDLPQSSPIFMLDALPGLGQAPNTLDAHIVALLTAHTKPYHNHHNRFTALLITHVKVL